MSVVERLTRLSPGTVLPENLTDKKHASNQLFWQNNCQKCKGKKGRKIVEKLPKRNNWIVCSRCEGTGKAKYTGHQSSTKSRKQSQFTSTELAGYAASAKISDLEWKSVQAHICNEYALIPCLAQHTFWRAEKIRQAESWDYPEEYKEDWLWHLSVMAVDEMVHPARYRKAIVYAFVMDCSKRSWYRKWNRKYQQIKTIPSDWLGRGIDAIAEVM